MTILVPLLAPLCSTLAVPLDKACSIEWLQPQPQPQLALLPLASTRLLERPAVYGAGTNASLALVPFKGTDAWNSCDAWQITAVALVIYSVGLFALHLSDLVRTRKSRRAATEVQRAARGRAARIELKRLHHTAIVLQATARRSSASRAYKMSRNAAVKMQKLMRRHLDRVRQRQHVDECQHVDDGSRAWARTKSFPKIEVARCEQELRESKVEMAKRLSTEGGFRRVGVDRKEWTGVAVDVRADATEAGLAARQTLKARGFTPPTATRGMRHATAEVLDEEQKRAENDVIFSDRSRRSTEEDLRANQIHGHVNDAVAAIQNQVGITSVPLRMSMYSGAVIGGPQRMTGT